VLAAPRDGDQIAQPLGGRPHRVSVQERAVNMARSTSQQAAAERAVGAAAPEPYAISPSPASAAREPAGVRNCSSGPLRRCSYAGPTAHPAPNTSAWHRRPRPDALFGMFVVPPAGLEPAREAGAPNWTLVEPKSAGQRRGGVGQACPREGPAWWVPP
jgi:hypothetical protein